jgi:toxin ParE1/3/4
MARFRVTKAAERDLVDIGRYTQEEWGEVQGRRYLRRLDARFRRLAQKPHQGRRCDEVRAGYWRYHEAKHVIFYRIAKDHIVEIIRVLHERMLPELHL